MENLDLVYQETSNSQSPTHSMLAERGGRQAIQTRPDHPNRVVSPSRGLLSNMQQVAQASNRPRGSTTSCLFLCHLYRIPWLQQCLPWEDLDAYAFPPAAILGKVVEKLQDSPCKKIILIAPGWPNMPWFWDLVTMSSQIPLSLPFLANMLTQPFNQIPLRNLTTQNKPKPPCMVPRASAIKDQGFSEAVAERIEAPQRRSTRSVYEAKWTIFTKWCLTHQVDFRAPPVKSVADFLMYLFQNRKLQPSTIDGYRSAIADKLGNSPINISKDENLTCLLDSFHRDRPNR